jgi:hypothetical protein
MSYSLTVLNYDHDIILKALQDIKDTMSRQTVNVERATGATGGHELAQDTVLPPSTDHFKYLAPCLFNPHKTWYIASS